MAVAEDEDDNINMRPVFFDSNLQMEASSLPETKDIFNKNDTNFYNLQNNEENVSEEVHIVLRELLSITESNVHTKN